ncbi:hypothetical protein ACTU6V_12670 [Microbacterium sp. A204]|uniref:hypothetical protein n=1 Tax=Microbacterium sp. A204 TaxID=3457321 RepID=UPI003FD2BB9A
MNTSVAKLSATSSALVLAAITLVGCTSVAEPPAADPLTKPAGQAPLPSATPTAADVDADTCPHFLARIHFGTMRANISGKLVDQGPREFATGTVGLDDDGNIVSYTVAPGDAPVAIGDRLCIDYAVGLPQLNHVRTIHPGQVLRLSLDPDVAWVPYFNPHDAPAGFQQIPYQQAIEAMAAAGDAGDVDAMRAIWADELSAMFSNPEHIDMIQRALDAGDLTVLNQMFS